MNLFSKKILSVLIISSYVFLFPLAKKNKIFSFSQNNFRWVKYKVRRGDSLSSISKKFNVSIRRLKRYNSFLFRSKRSKIYVGQYIKVKRKRVFERGIHPPIKNRSISFLKPVKRYRIIKRYKQYGDNKNYGVLYRVYGQKKIFATASGKVIQTGYMKGYGNYILVDHGKGWLSMYSFIKKSFVKTGQFVNRYTKLAKASRKKFFFLISYKGKPINPALLMSRMKRV